MTDIDNSKNVYLFTHGRADLVEKSIELLTSNGFSKEKIIMACLLYTSPSPRD